MTDLFILSNIQYAKWRKWYVIDFLRRSTWHLYLLEINLASLFLLFGERAEKWERTPRWMEELYKPKKNKTIFMSCNCHRESASSCLQPSTAATKLFHSAMWDSETERPDRMEAQTVENWCLIDCFRKDKHRRCSPALRIEINKSIARFRLRHLCNYHKHTSVHPL